MEHLPDLRSDRPERTMIDPCHYVHQADLALLHGSREEAEALIAKAYLAFDLVLADCDEVTRPGMAWSGRNSRAEPA